MSLINKKQIRIFSFSHLNFSHHKCHLKIEFICNKKSWENVIWIFKFSCWLYETCLMWVLKYKYAWIFSRLSLKLLSKLESFSTVISNLSRTCFNSLKMSCQRSQKWVSKWCCAELARKWDWSELMKKRNSAWLLQISFSVRKILIFVMFDLSLLWQSLNMIISQKNINIIIVVEILFICDFFFSLSNSFMCDMIAQSSAI